MTEHKIDHSQLYRGTLEGCVLFIISYAKTYGYQIAQSLRDVGFAHVSESTIYPILLRLESKKWIVSTFELSPLGPNRKYYTITSAGQDALDNFYQQWQQLTEIVNALKKGKV